MSESVLPMFSRSFIVSGLIFRSLIHFVGFFVCVYGFRKCPSLKKSPFLNHRYLFHSSREIQRIQ